MYIHHMQHKLAAKHGFELAVAGDPGQERVEVRKIGTATVVAFNTSAAAAIDAAIGRKGINGVDAKPAAPKVMPGVRARATKKPKVMAGTRGAPKPPKKPLGTIVDPKYRKQYGKDKHCGDEMALRLNAYCRVPTGHGKQTRLDTVRVRKVAEDNGVWKDTYADLNPGQLRMTVGVVLRRLEQNGTKVRIPTK